MGGHIVRSSGTIQRFVAFYLSHPDGCCLFTSFPIAPNGRCHGRSALVTLLPSGNRCVVPVSEWQARFIPIRSPKPYRARGISGPCNSAACNSSTTCADVMPASGHARAKRLVPSQRNFDSAFCRRARPRQFCRAGGPPDGSRWREPPESVPRGIPPRMGRRQCECLLPLRLRGELHAFSCYRMLEGYVLCVEAQWGIVHSQRLGFP